MESESDAAATVRRYLEAVTAFDVDAVRELLDPAVVQTEHPNRLYPRGQVRDAETMLRDLPRGRAVLRTQSYTVSELLAVSERVVVEAEWEGVLNVALGRLRPGDAMRAHVCMAFRVAGGLIVSQTNYDCYEDFAA